MFVREDDGGCSVKDQSTLVDDENFELPLSGWYIGNLMRSLMLSA